MQDYRTGNSVLIIDDDRKLADALARFLERRGFEVVIATEPSEGIERARGGVFSVIIVDRMMPGVDGLEACRRIRQFSNVPLLMISARGDDDSRNASLRVGCNFFLRKPFTPTALLEILTMLLSSAA